MLRQADGALTCHRPTTVPSHGRQTEGALTCHRPTTPPSQAAAKLAKVCSASLTLLAHPHVSEPARDDVIGRRSVEEVWRHSYPQEHIIRKRWEALLPTRLKVRGARGGHSGRCGPSREKEWSPFFTCAPPVPTQWHGVGRRPFTEHIGQWSLSSV